MTFMKMLSIQKYWKETENALTNMTLAEPFTS